MVSRVFACRPFTLKKSDQAVTLAFESVVSSQGEAINVDPTMFQRLVRILEATPELLPSAFEHELSNIPTSLFEPSDLPREARKHILAAHIWFLAKHEEENVHDVHYVINGGFLLHRLAWGRWVTYNQLIASYVDYVGRRYHKASVVLTSKRSCLHSPVTTRRTTSISCGDVFY